MSYVWPEGCSPCCVRCHELLPKGSELFKDGHLCYKCSIQEDPMKHSDKKETFETGAQRDTDEGKGRPSLISPVLIHRLGVHLAKGAEHYGADNWTQGMPYRRTADSMIRHIFQWLACDESEDHLAAVCFGAMCLMTYESNPDPIWKAGSDDRDESLKRILPPILTLAPSDATLEHEGKKPSVIMYDPRHEEIAHCECGRAYARRKSTLREEGDKPQKSNIQSCKKCGNLTEQPDGFCIPCILEHSRATR